VCVPAKPWKRALPEGPELRYGTRANLIVVLGLRARYRDLPALTSTELRCGVINDD
jgi:hypothetical protein